MSDVDSSQDVSRIEAIDVHAHYGPYRRASFGAFAEELSSDIRLVSRRARAARTTATFVSPTAAVISPGRDDVILWNQRSAEVVGEVPGMGFWVVVDPTVPETYDQARILLSHRRCVGMKIHPDNHGYPIDRYGEKLFAFAQEQGAIVLTHSGGPNSPPEEYARLSNDFSGVSIIMAHLGSTDDCDPTRHVRAMEKANHRNLYVDTSSSLNVLSRLVEWAVGEIGSDRILYGTDSPLYFAVAQRARIDYAEMEDRDKIIILRENALRLFERTLPEII